MDLIYNHDNIKLYKESTLILGCNPKQKNQIKESLNSTCSVIDKEYSYNTLYVKDSLSIFNVDSPYLDEIKNKKIDELTLEEYFFLTIMIKISKNDSIVVIDNVLSYLRRQYLKIILDVSKKNNVILIIFTNDLDTIYDSFKVLVLNNNNEILYGNYNEVILEERLLKRLGYEIPFYIDLSIQLKQYNKINNICYSKKELEEQLWK